MFILPAAIRMLQPCPQCDIWRWGLVGGDQVMNGISVLIKVVPENILYPSTR